MFSLENLPIIIFVVILLWNGLTILQFVTFLYYKFRYSNFEVMNRNELDVHTLEVMKPLEDFLVSKGFVYQTLMVHDSVMIGNAQKYHIAYYYNPENHVHAFIRTQPFRGALEAAKITYETIYESKNVCTTVNGERHHIPAVPKYVYLFDPYLSSYSEVYETHLNDRNIANEIISKETFTSSGIVDYKTYDEHEYIDSWKKIGIVKITEYGYRFSVSWRLWKFAKGTIKGYRKFSKILNGKQIEQQQHDNQSKSNAIITQLEEMEKPRGDSNKMLWFSISVIAFVLLFGLLGLSIVDIFILVLVLLIHELGHLAAMRYFGYTDTSIFFLPFGAAAVGKKEKRTAFEEYVVSLAGPLPGLLIGVGILVSNLVYRNSFSGDGHLQMYAIMSLIINYINLLPIYPLDGGRILQTLLLLRYPRGQFYFYLISLGVLVTAMVWMQDPILLIFVVIVALGLKQNYRISQLLKKLLGSYTQDEITKSTVATLLVEDGVYNKETLSAKANIAKQALSVMQTTKPSKLFLSLGLGLYLLFLLPPLAISYAEYYGMNNSEYSKLPPEAKEELNTLYATIASFKGLTEKDNESYNLEDSMDILEQYIHHKDVNRSVGEPLKNVSNVNDLMCAPSHDLIKLYKWHDGIENFFPDEDFYSYDKMQKSHQNLLDEEKQYDANFTTEYRIIISEYGYHGLAYHCEKEGLYRYSVYNYDEDHTKVFYSYNHMLKVTAEAYKEGIYYYDYDGFYVDEAKLFNLNRKYLSRIDKQRYDDLITYLQEKAIEYKDTPHEYVKKELLREMGLTYDSKMLPYIKMYLEDTDKNVRQKAVQTLGIIGDHSVIPLLLTHLDDDPIHCHGCALAGLSYLVDRSDVSVLDKVHQSVTQKKMWIRRNAYRVIAEIANEKSLPILKGVFKDEDPACKLIISEAFGRIGHAEALPLLEEYLTEINKMDFSVDYEGRSRSKNPHPNSLKDEVEKAISMIKIKNI